jgi:hypothetical protein
VETSAPLAPEPVPPPPPPPKDPPRGPPPPPRTSTPASAPQNQQLPCRTGLGSSSSANVLRRSQPPISVVTKQ